MLSIDKEILELKLYGTEYKLELPTVDELEAIEKNTKELGELGAIKVVLIECGLPKEVVGKMQAKHLRQVVEALAGKQS